VYFQIALSLRVSGHETYFRLSVPTEPVMGRAKPANCGRGNSSHSYGTAGLSIIVGSQAQSKANGGMANQLKMAEVQA
jgi:hypothetical protein